MQIVQKAFHHRKSGEIANTACVTPSQDIQDVNALVASIHIGNVQRKIIKVKITFLTSQQDVLLVVLVVKLIKLIS